MRSPFVRLRELLGDIPPGQSAISLAVGEPQHGVPSFVGPVLAASLDEFGKYPMNKGLDEFCAAAAAWLGRRFSLPRPVDPATEVLILNGSREGLFLAGIAAERWANGRSGRPAILMPKSVLRRLRGRRGCRPCRCGVPAGDRPDRLPARPRFAHRRAAVAHRRLLSGLAGQPAGLGREPGLSRATRRTCAQARVHRVQRRMLFRDLHDCAAAQHAGALRPRLRERGRVPVAVEALEPARPAGRLRRRRS